MASNNFLTVKSHLSEFKGNFQKDNISEASESGTSNSVTSAEDLQKLVVILGLNSVEDVHQERFRVDRRRLEAMLAEDLEESKTAQAFFHRVMTETNTLINWPARLKIGARSKKDPHVRIAGRLDDVRRAREKIMQLLDTRCNRVTMKIDVSYTDHSHIIGKGGATIKRVMTDTGCHIHFPDSNRTSVVEKSNQVSIAGDMNNVERARARVRALTPLVFCFELPIVASSQPLPDLGSPYVVQVQDQYNVQVMLRNRPKLHANILVVKGNQWEVSKAMEATTLLMNYMCGPVANQTHVQMTLEISPIHHSVVVGRGAEQLKVIMKGTNTQIMFPDAEDPNIPLIRKSCVTITGNIQDVYNARQQLVGSLPLVVIFDVSEDRYHADTETVARLMHKHNVYINVRRKSKQGIVSLVIKGIERCAGDIYEARRALLGGSEPEVTASIPSSYIIPSIPDNMAPNFTAFNAFSPSHANININSPCSPFMGDMGYGNMASPMYGHNPPTPGGYASPLSPGIFGAWMVPSPQPRPALHYPALAPPALYSQGAEWTPLHSPETSMPHMMPHYHHGTPDNRPPTINQLLNNPVTQLLNINSPGNQMMNPGQILDSNATSPTKQLNTSNPTSPLDNSGQGLNTNAVGLLDTSNPVSQHLDTSNTASQVLNTSNTASSGYQSNFTGSSASLDANNVSGAESHVASPSVSPISKPALSPTRSAEVDRSQHELASIIQELPLSERRAPGCEKKTLETLKMSPLSYRQKQAEAHKLMRGAVGPGGRVPTPRWAGSYFSRTSPGALQLSNDNNDCTTPEKVWNRSDMGVPNIKIQHSPPTQVTPPKPCHYVQMYDLLQARGLNKYIELFKRQEVDLCTFASLTEGDLTDLGVSAFGARRKMLLIISELRKQQTAYKGTSGVDRNVIKSPPYNTATLTQDKW